MSDVPINHPSRGAERRLFDMVMGEGGIFAVSPDGRFHVSAPKGRQVAVWWVTYYATFAPSGPGVPKELDGATLTERLLMRLVADQEVYWRNRDRRDRVKKRGRSNGEGKS
jgi:hypothetical protein